ncbi:hypothetical protein BK411_14270 [Vibrio splendidus]|nr:hypothetical protein BK411_14270 [Vibrio splendidus]
MLLISYKTNGFLKTKLFLKNKTASQNQNKSVCFFILAINKKPCRIGRAFEFSLKANKII